MPGHHQQTLPSVVGGNPAFPAAKRLITPTVIPPVPRDDPSPFGSTWTVHDDDTDPDHPSPFHANLWWQYANLTAHKANVSGCYVCSILPHAASQPHLYASPLSETHSLSVLNQTMGLKLTNPNAPRHAPLPLLTKAPPLGLRATLNHNDLDHCTGINGTCFQLCVNVTGANLKGSITPSHCKSIHSIPPTAPTVALDEIWWLCGWRVYMALPRNLSAICAPVRVSDHTYLLTLEDLPTPARPRRRRYVDFKPHDAIWGSDVPLEHKHWTTGQKVILALFPNLGVGKNMLRLETIDYRFQSFVNASIAINDAQNKELTATRLMVLQNRMALDLSLAPQGGVCALIGESCCTYIPDENSTIIDAMRTMKNLRYAMSKDPHPQAGWLDWLFSGTWSQVLVKLIFPFVAVIVLFLLLCALCSCCVVPMTKRMVARMFVSHLHAYNLVKVEDIDSDIDSDVDEDLSSV